MIYSRRPTASLLIGCRVSVRHQLWILHTTRSQGLTVHLYKAPFILAIFLAFGDCSAIKWALNPIAEFIAQQSRELKNLLKIASINRALSGLGADRERIGSGSGADPFGLSEPLIGSERSHDFGRGSAPNPLSILSLWLAKTHHMGDPLPICSQNFQNL